MRRNTAKWAKHYRTRSFKKENLGQRYGGGQDVNGVATIGECRSFPIAGTPSTSGLVVRRCYRRFISPNPRDSQCDSSFVVVLILGLLNHDWTQIGTIADKPNKHQFFPVNPGVAMTFPLAPIKGAVPSRSSALHKWRGGIPRLLAALPTCAKRSGLSLAKIGALMAVNLLERSPKQISG